jgi:hypothetical protein
MKNANLVLHCGAQKATREQVFNAPVPRATETYMALPHESFVTRIEKQLTMEGIKVDQSQFALNKGGEELFGLFQLTMPDCPTLDFCQVLGLRNSYNKRFSASVVIGGQVFVCDNLAFSGEITFARRHTPNLIRDLTWMIAETIAKLPAKFAKQSERYDAYKNATLTEAKAHDLIIRLLDAGTLNTTDIPHVLKEYREPSHKEFAQDFNAWRLFNATTEVIKGDVWRLPKRTEALHNVIDAEFKIVSE